jgi:CheY-like chemotaxis protein
MNLFVLMLEGDGDDRYITEQTLSELHIKVSIQFASNSTEFFKLLSEQRRPALILIDYNSVPDDGLEVLKKLKGSSNYNDIPVVILSDSNLGKYRNECYRHGASSFIKKPETVDATNRKIASFFNYWFNVVEM